VTAADVKFLLLGTIVARFTLRGRFELAQKAPNPLNRCPHTIECLTDRVTSRSRSNVASWCRIVIHEELIARDNVERSSTGTPHRGRDRRDREAPDADGGVAVPAIFINPSPSPASRKR